MERDFLVLHFHHCIKTSNLIEIFSVACVADRTIFGQKGGGHIFVHLLYEFCGVWFVVNSIFVIICREKFANIEVFEVVLLPAAKWRIFNCNSETVILVLTISEQFGETTCVSDSWLQSFGALNILQLFLEHPVFLCVQSHAIRTMLTSAVSENAQFMHSATLYPQRTTYPGGHLSHTWWCCGWYGVLLKVKR